MASPIEITISDKVVPTGRMVKIVRFSGLFDESNADDKSVVIYDLINTLVPGAILIFDFSELSYMNSKAIGYLTDWYLKVTNDKQGMLVLTQLQSGIIDILDTVGTLQVMTHFVSMDDAVAYASQ